MLLRDIAIDDLKHKLDTKGSLFDVLLATVERATEIYNHERKTAQTRPKRKIEKPSSSEPKRRKIPNPANNINNGDERPTLPERFKNAIEEMARGANAPAPEARLVIQKQLYGTDLSSGHNRLSIPMNQIADDFLTEGEKEHLRGYGEGKKKNYLDVRVVGPSPAAERAKLCRWDMAKKDGGKTSSSYVINGTWNAIVAKNRLRVGVVVQLWCFRVHRELCFALVRLPPGNHAAGA
ncbi:putative B3 domain-containing protein At5g35780 [Salvia hispanica]|uniref:putative B3 domain-containing protein At5g35780 n=1 Tax=Salvia hispanica TaxID=49212 RepID=UPI0020090768|nr:putative B3 domain-containing protein At5g35780 [Salvia hispanica]